MTVAMLLSNTVMLAEGACPEPVEGPVLRPVCPLA